jgi:uncharacterized membrane protein YfcA
MFPQILAFFCIAFIPSIIGAVSGIGGGIIIKPALDAAAPALGAPGPAEINFLSGCTVLTMSAVSLLRSLAGRHKGGAVLEGRRGTALAAGAALGGLCGRLVFAWIAAPSQNSAAAADNIIAGRHGVSRVQSFILILLTLAVLLYTLKKERIAQKKLKNLPACALLGLFLGMTSAFLGIGGGPINIMIIAYCFSMDAKTTALHSLYVIFLSQLASLILTAAAGAIPPVGIPFLLAAAAGGAGGGLTGSLFAGKLSGRQTDRLFMAVLVGVVFLCAWNLAAAGLAVKT